MEEDVRESLAELFRTTNNLLNNVCDDLYNFSLEVEIVGDEIIDVAKELPDFVVDNWDSLAKIPSNIKNILDTVNDGLKFFSVPIVD